jgi:hypothetical protein
MSYENPTRILDTSLGEAVKTLDANRAQIFAQIEARKKERQKADKKKAEEAKREEKEANARRRREYTYKKGVDESVANFNSKFSDNVLTINDATTLNFSPDTGEVYDQIEITKDQLEQDYNAYQAALAKDPNASLQDINPIYETNFDIESIYLQEHGGPVDNIKDEIEFYWTEMSKVDEGSEKYMEYKKNIDTILQQAPGFIATLNQTVDNTQTAWDYNGNVIKPAANMEGLLLYDGKPDFELRQDAAKQIRFKQNQGRFKYIYKDGKSYVEYTSPQSFNGKNKLLIEEGEYKKAVEGGDVGGLVNVTDGKYLKEVLDKIFDDGTENEYKRLVTTSNTKETKLTKDEKKEVITQRIKNFENANKMLEDKVNLWIDSKGLASNYDPNLQQSNWQMLGGPNEDEEGGEMIYTGTPEQIARAKKLMYQYVKRQKGGDTGIVGNGITVSDLAEFDEDMSVTLSTGEGILLDVTEINKYAPGLQKTAAGTDKKAGYNYNELYQNFDSLSNKSNNKGITAVLNGVGEGEYYTGEQLLEKFPNDIDPKDIDKNMVYELVNGVTPVPKPKITKDFDAFIDEVNKQNKGVTGKSHNKAKKNIDRTQPIASNQESDGGSVDPTLPPLPGMA